MKVVILTGADRYSTRVCLERLQMLSSIDIAAVFLDCSPAPFARRWKNLKRNIRREGVSYAWTRLGEAVRALLDKASSRVAAQSQVERLMHEAFPYECFSLEELAARTGVTFHRTGNLNDPETAAAIRDAHADLGVVIGTRVLRKSTFAIPRIGCINLHKGKVPEYRGMPPGFWELYDGRKSCGITVHFVDEGLDTGDIVAETAVDIHPKETPESLRRKLDDAGADLLQTAVDALARGTAERRPQPKSDHRTRTSPTLQQKRELARRAPHIRTRQERRLYELLKRIYNVFLYYSGLFHAIRALRERRRASVLLYHRVNDYSEDALTTSRRRFAEQLMALRSHYNVISTSHLVQGMKRGALPPRSVVIHFDDTYGDVASYAAPLLRAAGIPAASFISSGYIDTSRRFAHDEAKYPQQFANMTSDQVRSLADYGIEVGAHTVNHVDMGTVPLQNAAAELSTAKLNLESISEQRVTVFSFPFGRPDNIRPEVAALVPQFGYQAMFSAYGGFVRQDTSVWNIPRFGVNEANDPIDLLMRVEGLSLADLWHRVRKLFGKQTAPAGEMS